MNLSEIREDVKGRLRDETGQLYDDASLDRYINQAQDDMAETVRLEDTKEIAVEEGVAGYDLPVDGEGLPAWVRVEDVTLNGTVLEETTRAFALRHDLSTRHFYVYGGELFLEPAPDDEGTLKVYYLKQPEPLVQDTDTPDFPRRWHEALVVRAVFTALDEDDHPSADRYRGMYFGMRQQVSEDRNDPVRSKRVFGHERWS